MSFLERLFKRLDGSLRARVLIPTAVLFAVTFALMVAGAVQFYGSDMERARRDRAEIVAKMVGSGVSTAMLAGRPQEVTSLLEAMVEHRSDLVSASLVSSGGYISASSRRSLVGREAWTPAELAGAVETHLVFSPEGNRGQYAVLQPIPNGDECAKCHDSRQRFTGWLDLRFTREPVLVAKGELAKTLALAAAAAFVCVLGIALWLLGREVVRPIQGLVTVMKRAEVGELTVRADVGRPDEIGVAARGFDATLAALRRSQAELAAFYQERMVRADRFATVGEVATGLAHEIKNPLAGLSGALELLAEDLAADPRHGEVVTEMQHQVRRLTHTMESLLSFARPAPAKLRSTDANACIEKVLFLVRQQFRNGAVELQAALTPDLPAVLADPSQLEQVFLNLCLNACQAMRAHAPTGTLTVRSRRGEGSVLVEIADTGPGIPAEIRAQIFKPFFTTKREGNGLGLAISARILAEHGGHIGYRCPPGGGTVFTVTLQQASPVAASAGASPGTEATA